ncbi:SET and MYND domain-containing protein 4-like [Neocloeon triangulifer]|uniref:SET and MYND domain-containing protein 4-like n=1 Tax=Neocloeon triangulifer TaxID=2078957 RepID=UPI00286F7C19|nr:SET and MYND domain-containing protein 4-like [Neocloeon triangulifer]
MNPAECVRLVLADTKEAAIAEMKEVFLSGGDKDKINFSFPFIYPVLKKAVVLKNSEKSNAKTLKLIKKISEDLQRNEFHLAFKNFNEAQSYTKGNELAEKLESLKKDLLDKSGLSNEIKTGSKVIDDYKKEEEPLCHKWTADVPKLYAGQSKQIQAFSKATLLHQTEALGRHLVAAQHIKPGCVVGIELPLANVLYSSCKYTHCSYCLTKSHILVPCQNCAQALYCGDSCRVSAWAAYHSFECQIAGDLEAAGLSPVDVLTVRILSLFKPEKILEAISQSGTANLRGFESDSLHSFLQTYCDPRSWKFEETLAQVTTALVILKICNLDEHPERVALSAFLLRCLQGIPLISHEISERCNCGGRDFSDHGIALGVFLALSLVNHSCDQNVVKQYYGRHSIMRAIRVIRKGEQIVDSYGPHFIADPFEERKQVLQSRFRFKCVCEACEKRWPTQAEVPWSLQVEISAQVRLALKEYLEEGRVFMRWKEDLEKTVETMDCLGKRICVQYFVIQQILKVLYASEANYVFCKNIS